MGDFFPRDNIEIGKITQGLMELQKNEAPTVVRASSPSILYELVRIIHSIESLLYTCLIRIGIGKKTDRKAA